MASINKHHLFVVVLLILKRRRRRENRKNEEKRIWVKIMNENRLELGAFSTIFLLAWEFDCTSLFEQSNSDLSIRLFELCICLKFAFFCVFFLTSGHVRTFNRMQLEHNCAAFFSFFPSLPLREFPCEQKFFLTRKFYAKA